MAFGNQVNPYGKFASQDTRSMSPKIPSNRVVQRPSTFDPNKAFGTQFSDYYGRDLGLRDTLQDRFLNFGGTADDILGKALPGGSYYDAMLKGLPYLTGEGMAGGGSGGGGGINLAGYFDEPAAIYRGLGQGLNDPLLIDTANMFMRTGGFTGDELGSMRRASLAPTRSIYQNAADKARRMASTTGNPYAGFDRMTREQNDALSNIATQTESNIAQMVQQGRLSGINAKTAIDELDAQMKAMGAGGLTDIEKARLQAELQNASLNESAAGRGDAMNRAIASYYQQAAGAGFDEAQFRAGLDQYGLSNALALYGMAPGATQGAASNILGQGQLDLTKYGIDKQADANKRPWWQSVLGAVPVVGDVIDMFGGGGG